MLCDAGEYFDATAAACLKCPRGQFNGEANQTTCSAAENKCSEVKDMNEFYSTDNEGSTNKDQCKRKSSILI